MLTDQEIRYTYLNYVKINSDGMLEEMGRLTSSNKELALEIISVLKEAIDAVLQAIQNKKDSPFWFDKFVDVDCNIANYLAAIQRKIIYEFSIFKLCVAATGVRSPVNYGETCSYVGDKGRAHCLFLNDFLSSLQYCEQVIGQIQDL